MLGEKDLLGEDGDDDSNHPDADTTSSLADKDESDTKILLEKEFDDFYEDRVHKSAGPVVFVSKTLGMLPVIWTEDETESECKSYFNLYTFVIFIGRGKKPRKSKKNKINHVFLCFRRLGGSGHPVGSAR